MSAGHSSRVHFTICSRNYLAYALTLRESLKKADPDENFVIVLCDPVEGEEVEAIEGLIGAEEMGLPYFWEMALRYDVMEFNTAIKPFVMQYFFDQGYKQALYLDPDLYIVKPLEHVYKALRSGATGVLTPHTTVPLDDGMKPSDITIMQSGIYNLGFGAFTNKPESRAFVDWWADRCRAECINRIDLGIFVDQKFCDLAPAFMPKLRILHHLGYNTAYWNLASRPITKDESGAWLSGGEELHFFHFSGVKPGNYEVFSKHQDRFQVDNIGDLRELLFEYLDALGANQQEIFSSYAYAYNQLEDGTKIPAEYRILLDESGLSNEKARRFFERPDHARFLRADPEFVAKDRLNIPRIVAAVYRRREDVQAAFGLATDAGRTQLMNWFFAGGAAEHKIPEPCVEATQAYWNAALKSREREEAAAAAGIAISTAPHTDRPAPTIAEAMENVPSMPQQLAFHDRIKAVARATLPVSVRLQIRKLLNRPRLEAAAPKRLLNAPPVRQVEEGMPFGVGLFGYHMTETGVGEGARNATRALNAVDMALSRHVLTTDGVFQDKFGSIDDFDGDISPYPINLFHVNADNTLHLPSLVDPRNLMSRYRIGYWAWELAQFPDAWLPALDQVDEVWAPSRFVADAVRAKTNKRVEVVPHPVVPAPAEPDRAKFGLPEDAFLVLTSFDLNSFFSRKNPKATIDAFLKAFPEEQDVRLVIKMHGGASDFDEERAALIHLIEGDSRIMVVDEVLERHEMDVLQQTVDCFISLHRSEGFGLNVAELMGRGKPVVSTAYSGSDEFVRPGAAFPIGFTMVPVGKDNYPFWQNQYWAEPSVRSAAAALREIYEKSERSAEIARAGEALIKTEFSYEVIGKRMSDRLKEIYASFS